MTFKPGQSGNPDGRPVGTSDKRTELRKLLQEHASALVNKAVEMALAGDVQALRLCLERIIPKVRSENINLNLPDVDFTDPTAILPIGANVISAVAHGALTPEQGQTVMAMLDSQRKTIETEDLARKVQWLEEKISP